jgi:hypothetical protein
MAESLAGFLENLPLWLSETFGGTMVLGQGESYCTSNSGSGSSLTASGAGTEAESVLFGTNESLLPASALHADVQSQVAAYVEFCSIDLFEDEFDLTLCVTDSRNSIRRSRFHRSASCKKLCVWVGVKGEKSQRNRDHRSLVSGTICDERTKGEKDITISNTRHYLTNCELVLCSIASYT